MDAILPALDEAEAIPLVLAGLRGQGLREIVVVDNGSRDATAEVARAHGATVVREPRRGYGAACQAGIAYLRTKSVPPQAVVFLDADASDDPRDLPRLLAPLAEGHADLVVGSRMRGRAERGALAPHARLGNWIAARLIRWLYGAQVTDLGPFRAIRWDALMALGMEDRDYGWTAEMQVKALRRGLRVAEVPVAYRPRVGRSKISGTWLGSARAGWKIVTTILRYAVRD